jgi:hypothetical protein
VRVAMEVDLARMRKLLARVFAKRS